MARFRNVFCMLLVAAVVAGASADTITTLFANNNAGSAGGGVYFDVTTGANPIEITSYEVNSSALAGNAMAFEVFTRPGTASGFQNSNAGWTSQATGTGNTTGAGGPSPVSLSNPFVLPANSVTGMAITLGTVGHAYTNGNGMNQHYANGTDIQLDLGSANNSIFGAGVFSPRVWNGSITYNVIPEPSTLALLAMGGLALIRRR